MDGYEYTVLPRLGGLERHWVHASGPDAGASFLAAHGDILDWSAQ